MFTASCVKCGKTFSRRGQTVQLANGGTRFDPAESRVKQSMRMHERRVHEAFNPNTRHTQKVLETKPHRSRRAARKNAAHPLDLMTPEERLNRIQEDLVALVESLVVVAHTFKTERDALAAQLKAIRDAISSSS